MILTVSSGLHCPAYIQIHEEHKGNIAVTITKEEYDLRSTLYGLVSTVSRDRESNPL
jgi:hypothetical protein